MNVYIPILEDALERLRHGEDYKTVYPDIPKPPGTRPEARRRTNILTPTEKAQLKDYAAVARHYRSTMPANHPITKAVKAYESLATDLYRRGASIPEMADAAEISYNAMKKRVKP